VTFVTGSPISVTSVTGLPISSTEVFSVPVRGTMLQKLGRRRSIRALYVAVRMMASVQFGRTLDDAAVAGIVSFLESLTSRSFKLRAA
jgi:phosphate/sulfate permease